MSCVQVWCLGQWLKSAKRGVQGSAVKLAPGLLAPSPSVLSVPSGASNLSSTADIYALLSLAAAAGQLTQNISTTPSDWVFGSPFQLTRCVHTVLPGWLNLTFARVRPLQGG